MNTEINSTKYKFKWIVCAFFGHDGSVVCYFVETLISHLLPEDYSFIGADGYSISRYEGNLDLLNACKIRIYPMKSSNRIQVWQLRTTY